MRRGALVPLRVSRYGIASSLAALLAAGLLLSPTACGGGGGGGDGVGGVRTPAGIVLVDFRQASIDNLALNQTLEFTFSAPIDPNTVAPDSIQIREATKFGTQVPGRFVVVGERVTFEPQLPSLCDLSDAAFRPGTDYKVTLVGSPEEFALRGLDRRPLDSTIVTGFRTRGEGQGAPYDDPVPGVGPTVVSTSPADGAAQVAVGPGNAVVIRFSEDLDPCTVNEGTILVQQFATGDPTTGFVPAQDLTPGDPFTWGSGTPTTPARRVRCRFDLRQTVLSTEVEIRPVFGEFPDDALLVVQLTSGVRDLGGLALMPTTIAFTTENLPLRSHEATFEFDGDVPVDANVSTGEVNTARSPSRAQGFLLFAGDGDNGTPDNRLLPSGPDSSRGPTGCASPYAGSQAQNDGVADDFDAATDTVLDTGSTRNTCANATDGSTAVVFEYRSFRIRSGATVRLVGVNPALILVQGDAVIEAGARLLARGDGAGGSPSGDGQPGAKYNNTSPPASVPGGTGVAGGGNGGTATTQAATGYGGTGLQGRFTNGGADDPSVATTGGPGSGHGNVSAQWKTQTQPNNRNSTSGGGGGHVPQSASLPDSGVAGTALPNDGSTNPTQMDGPADGAGGVGYGDVDGRMETAEAGSGGGAGGELRGISNAYGRGSAGSGGAGGGFVDITARGDITVHGTIDASGGRGGNGASGSYYWVEPGTGGGGGGSGGGIRLLTPKSIILSSTTVIRAAGGLGGTGGITQGGGLPVANNGGKGGNGRIVLEDGDSIVNTGAAQLVPAEGQPGFWRSTFDVSRFQGGGLANVVETEVMDAGPFSPTYVAPDQSSTAPDSALVPAPGTPRRDFVAGIPSAASRGLGKTGIFVEMRGYMSNPDGSVDAASDTGWRSVGYFTDSGAETAPDWHGGTAPPPGDVAPLPGNVGDGLAALAGHEFFKVRLTFYLPQGIGPFVPGPWLDRWRFYVTLDQ